MPCTIRHASVAARMEIHLMHGSRRAETPSVPALQGQSRPRAQMLLLNPTDTVSTTPPPSLLLPTTACPSSSEYSEHTAHAPGSPSLQIAPCQLENKQKTTTRACSAGCRGAGLLLGCYRTRSRCIFCASGRARLRDAALQRHGSGFLQFRQFHDHGKEYL